MPCCKCNNGVHARYRSCECVKHNRPCLSCHAGKYGRCSNTLPSDNQAESLPTTSTSSVTQACASTRTFVSPTHSPLAARSPSLAARNSKSPSNAHMNSTPTQTQPQIIGSPQQLLHPRRGRSQDGEPSREFSGSHSQPTSITQLQPISTPGDSSQPTAPNQPDSQTVGASRQLRKQHCVCWRLSGAYCTLNVEVPHDAPCTGCIPRGSPKYLAWWAGSLCLPYLPPASLQQKAVFPFQEV